MDGANRTVHGLRRLLGKNRVQGATHDFRGCGVVAAIEHERRH
jgi:hypothetical protein